MQMGWNSASDNLNFHYSPKNTWLYVESLKYLWKPQVSSGLSLSKISQLLISVHGRLL